MVLLLTDSSGINDLSSLQIHLRCEKVPLMQPWIISWRHFLMIVVLMLNTYGG